jgi:glycosyltransferase involved in cell wall biosynthesis
VSVIVMTKNEELNIAKCLRSVSAFDEVHVVDSASEDRTCAIAAGMGRHVRPFRWNGAYPKKKQWCLENLALRHDWVFYVDADEEVPAERVEEIRALMLRGPAHDGYFAGYDYVFMGRVLRRGHRRVYKLALFNRHRGRFLPRDDLDLANSSEVEANYQPRIDGRVGTLRHRMLHDDREALFHFFERHNHYSDWEALLRTRGTLLGHGESELGGRRLAKQLFAVAPFKGLIAFLHSFVLRAGFRDGAAGFHFALARAFYYWQIAIKSRELLARPSRAGTGQPAVAAAPGGNPAGRGQAIPERTVS